MVGEREYKFLEILSAEKEISQRKLAKTLGISLGMTNLILKNLIKKGYVKIKGLNRKKVRYLLTPRGFSEKARKSYNYTVKTIREFSRYVENLRNFILNEYEKGTKEFYIKGDGEILNLIEFVFKTIEIPQIKWKRISKKSRKVYIICGKKEISVWEII